MIEYRDHTYTYWLIDQGSANGTFINGKRVEGMHRLNHGDCLHFHTAQFLFLMPGHESADQTQIVLLEGAGERAA